MTHWNNIRHYPRWKSDRFKPHYLVRSGRSSWPWFWVLVLGVLMVVAGFVMLSGM